MHPSSHYSIDDTGRVRPTIRLCNIILRQALAEGTTRVAFLARPGAMPAARVERADGWEPYMEFPVPVFDGLVARLREMAGVRPGDANVEGRIFVRSAEHEAVVTVSTHRAADGSDEIVLERPRSQSVAT